MILNKENFDKYLLEYYVSHYSEKESDIWYEQPAVNVWVFSRNEKIITLKSNLLTGEITEQIEDIRKL